VAQLPLGVIGAAIGTALLPLLARHVRGARPLSAHRAQNRAVELSLAFALPAAAAMIVLADPIVTTLFQRGAFGAEAAAATAAALAAYAAGLPGFVLVKALAPGFFARGDTATPVKVAAFVVALNLALNLGLTTVFGHVGIALATSLSAAVNALGLAMLLARRGQLRLDRRLRRAAPRLMLAALVMAAILLAGAAWFPDSGPLARALSLAALVGLGLASYFGLAQAIGALDLREAARLLRRRSGGA